jgi:hypothetical protein
MPSGDTTTTALADSLPSVIAAARQVREFEGVMPQLVDTVTLAEGTGNVWNEISLAQLTSQQVTETTHLDNPQQMSDTLFSITPTVVGIHTLVTDRVAARISKLAYSKLGTLAQNANQRKKDDDGITVLDGATTSIPGAGSTLTFGNIAAATVRISSNTTERGTPPYRCVLHGFQLKDVYDEITAGVGTYPVGEGLTARVFADDFRGMIGGAQVYEDGNITIDASADAKGGVFAKDAIVLVQGRRPRTETRREPHIGGGATSIFLYDEYAYGERSSGNWLYEIYSDATSPTS